MTYCGGNFRDILCTDKTGTLTNDHVVMIKYLDCHEASSLRVLQFAYLNSSFQTGLKNLLDKAIIAFGDETGDSVSDYAKKWYKIDEIPFDFERRRLSVILENKELGDCTRENNGRFMVTKGAMEEMLDACSWVQETDEDSSVIPMTEANRTRLLAVGESLNIDGLRVLVVATKVLPPKEVEAMGNTFEVIQKFPRNLPFQRASLSMYKGVSLSILGSNSNSRESRSLSICMIVKWQSLNI